jgi:hypothetical protein
MDTSKRENPSRLGQQSTNQSLTERARLSITVLASLTDVFVLLIRKAHKNKKIKKKKLHGALYS